MITSLKPRVTQMQSFIVADIADDVHVPYAVGYMLVSYAEEVLRTEIDTYYSEDYPIQVFRSFPERSDKMLYDFIERLVVVCCSSDARIVYFQNLSRFDGILLLRYFVLTDKYTFKPILRNNRLYEVAVYRSKKLLFRLRDSLTLLTGSLSSLAKHLCPHLGCKGSIDHMTVQVENLIDMREQLLEYMSQDIRLLGGVMKKAQSIVFEKFGVDIVSKLTLSSLSLHIFRTGFDNQQAFPIHIPGRNTDTFIQQAYYGGHADTYIPRGSDLYYYDVNSLYPYIMSECFARWYSGMAWSVRRHGY